jgi:hypothetical protein
VSGGALGRGSVVAPPLTPALSPGTGGEGAKPGAATLPMTDGTALPSLLLAGEWAMLFLPLPLAGEGWGEGGREQRFIPST